MLNTSEIEAQAAIDELKLGFTEFWRRIEVLHRRRPDRGSGQAVPLRERRWEKILNKWLLLTIAIVSEVVATSALKSSDGFTRLWPSCLVVGGYAIAFVCLSFTLRQIPIGITYAVWSGAGIVLISLVGLLLFKQKLDMPALLGMALIIAGIVVMHVYSNNTSL